MNFDDFKAIVDKLDPELPVVFEHAIEVDTLCSQSSEAYIHGWETVPEKQIGTDAISGEPLMAPGFNKISLCDGYCEGVCLADLYGS